MDESMCGVVRPACKCSLRHAHRHPGACCPGRLLAALRTWPIVELVQNPGDGAGAAYVLHVCKAACVPYRW
jgi:hypothetical protein